MFNIGDVVRVERDEEKYPPKGSWPRYRGKVGTVVTINRRDKEIGVSFESPNMALTDMRTDAWFKEHELVLNQ